MCNDNPDCKWEDESLSEWDRWQALLDAVVAEQLTPDQAIDIASDFSVETRRRIKKSIDDSLRNCN